MILGHTKTTTENRIPSQPALPLDFYKQDIYGDNSASLAGNISEQSVLDHQDYLDLAYPVPLLAIPLDHIYLFQPRKKTV